ncbi:MAG: IS5 family transposase [Chthoniobacter sp.]
MKRYRQSTGGGLFAAIEHEQAVASKTTGILKLREVIDWERFRPLLEELSGYAQRDWSKGGKPPFDPVLMFKVLVLQKFHGLSDDATEEQIFDRTSFKSFLGLRIGDAIPDAKTLWDFKQRIEAEGRAGSRRLFEAFGAMLEGEGLIARAGSIVDASFVEAPRQRNDREQNRRIKEGERPEEFDRQPAVGRQKDSEARWTKKNEEVHYGWKNHVKADAQTKLILRAVTTPANVHDSQVFKELVDAQDRAVLADSAYHSEEHEAHLLALDAEEFLLRKAPRGQALSAAEQKSNHTISRIRVRVEHIFARMAQMGADFCRSIGLARATAHNHLCNLVYNMDRYACLRK